MSASLELRDDQLETLADLIADRMADRAAGELIDAAELARRINRSREFVYRYSAKLGAIRLGDGDRPRISFHWPSALERLADLEQPTPRPQVRVTRRPRRKRKATVELLPIVDARRL